MLRSQAFCFQRTMKMEFRQIRKSALSATALLAAGLANVSAAAQQALTGFEAFAQEPAISSAFVSPDGESLGTLQRLTKDGKQYLLVYDIDRLDKDPVTLGSSKMDIVQAGWVNNERLVVRFRQDVETLQEMGANTRLAYKLATIDKKGKRWLEIPRDRSDRRSEFSKTMSNFGAASIFDTLPEDPRHILVAYDDDSDFTADIFKVDVERGTARRVARNSNRISITYIDESGEPRLATRFDEGAEAQIYLARLAGSKEWIEIGRTEAKLDSNSSVFNAFELVGGPESNEFYVLSNHETDTSAIYIYDAEKQEFGEMQFMHPEFDATGLYTVTGLGGERRLVGFRYTGKAGDAYVFDPSERALLDAINEILPNADNDIVSRSRDGKTLVISSVGPRTPETFYLLKDQRLTVLGKSMPFLTEEMLSDVEWTSYKARDGMEIPAIVTIPDGEGPFPVVINPHGGPVARDYWGFDLWAQLLAHHGYLVIQPQFRISSGFGREHLEAGYAKWGYEMQDDLDDAVEWIAERGLGDKNRAAIFGWSYGGYAAFVGSFRDPNPYKCAISGAGVADVPYFRAWLSDFGSFTEKTYRRTVDGVNPLDHVDSVDVPILVIHGDIDERVPVDESRKFVKKLEEFEKDYRYIELEGANHFFGTIYYRHWMEMFPAMIDWLDNTCGLAEPRSNAAD